jgi:ADP-dependent NAD(P)H-hydrate dehydratase / NAD(P)H-hydrate epimerase
VSLPHWLTPLPDAEQMRAIDRWAIEERGVPSLDLMERAGQGVARVVEEVAPDGPLVVVCGKGNNGGDGLVLARLLRAAGRPVTVLCTAPPEEFSGDAAANLARLPGEAPLALLAGESGGESAAGGTLLAGGEPMAGVLEGATAIVDALLGTGFEGAPRGVVADAIEAIAGARALVVSVDVPSGVDASTGRVAGAAVSATATVTFHAAKPGLWIYPGKAHAGRVRTIDIGIPRGAPGDVPGEAPAAAPGEARVGLIEPAIAGELPRRVASSTKFSSGHVVVAGGSRDLSGAPRMAALASARAGAGYVTACLPASLQAALAATLLEVMTRPLPDAGGDLEVEGVPAVLRALGRGGALVLGPGLGRASGAVAFARELARQAPVAMVLDADGLNAHAGRLRDLARREAPTVLTPHTGELGRLLECDSEDVERERLASVRTAAEQARAVVVLKGDDTLIADPSGRVAVSRGGSPALATAGTGDVLSGVIAALLAQGLEAFEAACAGVWLHAEAGRVAARAEGSAEGVMASDVIAALPRARGRTDARARGRTEARARGRTEGRDTGGGS